MNRSQDPDLAALERLSSRLSRTLNTIEDQQWTMATPCAGWDLSALVDHVTGGNWFTSRILTGRSAEDAMTETMDLFGGNSVGGERAVSSVEAQLDAFHQPGALDRSHHHRVGDLTGRQVLRLRLHDLIVHTWDIDHTLAPPASIPPDLVEWGLEELADDGSLTAKHFGLSTAQRPEATNGTEAAYLRRFGR